MNFDPSQFEVLEEGTVQEIPPPVLPQAWSESSGGGQTFDLSEFEMLEEAPPAEVSPPVPPQTLRLSTDEGQTFDPSEFEELPNDPRETGIPSYDPSQFEAVNEGRLTFYTRFDDGPEYENGATAAPSPLTKERRAEEGVTIAVDPSLIPYGSKVRIPALAEFSKNGDGVFIAHDTGAAVKKRTASGGALPVLDVFVDGEDRATAQAKRDQIANRIGTGGVIYEVLESPGIEGKPLGPDASFWEKVKRRWGTGEQQAKWHKDAYDVAIRGGDWAEMRWAELEKLEPRPDPGAQGERWYSQAFLDAVEVGPGMKGGIYAGALRGAKYAATAAGTAALAGQLGPQVAVPEEIVTVPGAAAAGWAVGQTSGSFEYWYQQGVGMMYADMRKEGIPHDVASAVAQEMGIAYAGLEYVQVSKLIPGLRAAGRKLVAERLREAMARIAKEQGADYVKNIGQEVAQELVAIASGAIGEAASGVDVPDEDRGVMGRLLDTAKQSALVFPFLQFPKAAVQTVGALRSPRPERFGLEDVKVERRPPEEAAAAQVEQEIEVESEAQRYGPPAAQVEQEITVESEAQRYGPPASTQAPAPAQTQTQTQDGGSPEVDSGTLAVEYFNRSLQAQREMLRGQEAMQTVIREQQDVIDAMEHPELGPVTFLWGTPGVVDAKTGRLVRGFGVSHLIEQRNLEGNDGVAVAEMVPEIIAKGEASESYGPQGAERVNISHKGHTAVLSLFRNGEQQTWLLTGWKDNAPGDSQGVNPTKTYSQQPSGIQTDAGAGAVESSGPMADTITQGGADVNERPTAVDFSAAAAGGDLSGTVKPGVLKARTEGYQRIADQFVAKQFGDGMPPVVVVPDLSVAEEGDVAMQQAREHSRRGNRIEAFYDPFRNRVVAVAGNLSSDTVLKQKILHELVGHFGIEQVLLEQDAARFYSVTEGVWEKFRRSQFDEAWGKAHGYRTLEELAANYGFNPESLEGRTRTAVEHLARMAEADPNVSWVRAVIARFREVLRKAFPSLKLAWSDADVLAFLSQMRRGLGQQMRPEGEAVSYSSKLDDNADWRKVLGDDRGNRHDKDVARRAAQRAGEAFRGNRFENDGNPSVSEISREVAAGIYGVELGVKPLYHEHYGLEAEPLAQALKAAVSPGVEVAARDGHLYVYRPEAAERVVNRDPEAYPGDTVFDKIHRATQADQNGELLGYGARSMPEGDTTVILRDAESGAILTGFRSHWDQAMERAQMFEALWQEYEGVKPRVQVTRLGDAEGVQFSMVPSQVEAEEAAAGGPVKQRKFVESIKKAPGIHESVKEKVDSYYQVYSDKDAVEQARERINRLGLEAAMREVLDTNAKSNPPTKLTYVMGMDLMNRLQGQGRFEDSARLGRHMSENSTTQGQAIQALHMLARMTPEGVQYYAQQTIQKAMQDAGPEVKKKAGEVRRIREEMETRRYDEATGAVQTARQIEKELGSRMLARLSPEESARLQTAFRDLLIRYGEQPDVAVKELVELLTRDGKMTIGAAVKVAKGAVSAFRKQMRQQREGLLKQLLKVNVGRQALPKSMLEKWIALNKAGGLDDATLFAGIAERFGFPQFTPKDAARIKRLQEKYDRATDPELKLVAAAKMLEAVHELVPAKLADKIKAVQNMSLLLNPKTVIRNIGGNVAMFVLNTTVDAVNSGLIDSTTGLVTGKRTVAGLALAERVKGLAAPVVDFTKGFKSAQADGAGWGGALVEGVGTMLTLARLTNSEKFDEKSIQGSYRHIFSSRAMRLMEDVLTASLSVMDRAFDQSAYLASLKRQMNAARIKGEDLLAPTLEMMEEARMDAAKATFKDPTVVGKTLHGTRSYLNFLSTLGQTKRYGLGHGITAFATVPGSMLMKGAEFSPVGFVNSAYHLLRPLRGREFNQKAFTEAFSRALVGSGAFIPLGMWLYNLGIISAAPEDDRDIELFRRSAGVGGYRINQSELKRRMVTGNWWTPGAGPQEGDVIRSYDWLQPAVFPVAIGAEFKRTQEIAGLQAAKGRLVSLSNAAVAMMSGARTLEEQPLLQGLTRFSSDVGHHGMLEGLFRQVGAMPSMFVPTVVAQVAQLQDNSLRETRSGGWLEQSFARVLMRLPGLAKKYPLKYDAFGEAQERYQAGQNTLFNVMINPAFPTRAKDNPTIRLVEEVYRATGESPLPREAPIKMMVNGQQIEPTNEQLADYRYFTGKYTADFFNRLAPAPWFAGLSPEYKAKVLAQIVSDGGTLGKMAIFGHVLSKEDMDAIRKGPPETQEMAEAIIELVKRETRKALPQYVRPQ